MNPYNLYFYRIYRFLSKLGSHDLAFSVITFIVLFQLFNIVVLFPFPLVKEFMSFNVYVALIVFISLILFSVNFYLFVYKSKYLKVVEACKNESNKQKIISSVLTLLYIFLSVILLIL